MQQQQQRHGLAACTVVMLDPRQCKGLLSMHALSALR